MLQYLPSFALWGALFLSVVNIVASFFGLGPALTWVLGLPVWQWMAIPLAVVGIGFLVYRWVNSLMSGFAGMGIFWLNVLLAPFGYGLLGLSYAQGLIIAIAPYPFYFGIRWISDQFQ